MGGLKKSMDGIKLNVNEENLPFSLSDAFFSCLQQAIKKTEMKMEQSCCIVWKVQQEQYNRYNAINNKIMPIRLHRQPFNMTIIQVYAPTLI